MSFVLRDNSTLGACAFFELWDFSASDLLFFSLDALVQLSNKALALCHTELSQTSNNLAAKRLTESPGLVVDFKFFLKWIIHGKVGEKYVG